MTVQEARIIVEGFLGSDETINEAIHIATKCMEKQKSRREWYQRGYQDGLNADKWIPCEVEMPPQPKGNPLFENKPIELYLVSLSYADYPIRAFWNGKYFTDGWSKLNVEAWMPLPQPH